MLTSSRVRSDESGPCAADVPVLFDYQYPQHPCVMNPYAVDHRLSLDFETFPVDNFQYGCWRAEDKAQHFGVLCKKCFVPVTDDNEPQSPEE